MTILYDNLGYNRRMLLDLPFREGTGIITQDVAKPHHPITLVNTPTWGALASGKMAINLDGTTEYMQCLSADCVDLNFTSGNFSLGGWFTWSNSVHDSQILIARYEVSDSGWELYLTESGALRYMTLRMHHAGGATTRTGGYSLGWEYDTLYHFGVSRTGTTMQFYRYGEPITTVSDVLIDPETCTEDLVIGVRYTKDANYLSGLYARLVVAEEGLTEDDWRAIYRQQRDYA